MTQKQRETDQELIACRPSRAHPFVRSPYNYDQKAVSESSGLKCEDPSLAVQSQKDEADINYIVKMFGVTQTLPQTLSVPSSGDFTDAPDYHTAQTLLVQAQQAFMALPSGLRARFQNDAGQFLDAVHSMTAEELLTLGIERSDLQTITYKKPETIANPSSAPGTGLTDNPA